MTKITKRNFLVGGAALSATALNISDTNAQTKTNSIDEFSGLKTGQMKAMTYTSLPGFLSAEQIAPHYKNHYGGALKGHLALDKQIEEMITSGKRDNNAYATIQRTRTTKGNSALLHEVFFDGMTADDSDPDDILLSMINARFGSLDRWQDDFAAAAATGRGWAVLCYHKISGKLYNVVSDAHADGVYWQGTPVIALDMYEHSYYLDYQNKKGDYIGKYFDYINWQSAERRLKEAL